MMKIFDPDLPEHDPEQFIDASAQQLGQHLEQQARKTKAELLALLPDGEELPPHLVALVFDSLEDLSLMPLNAKGRFQQRAVRLLGLQDEPDEVTVIEGKATEASASDDVSQV
jgi:hypothetical protein